MLNKKTSTVKHSAGLTRTFALLFLFILPCLGFAQSKQEKAVARAVEILRKAMVDADSNVLDMAVLPGLTYGHSSGRIENKKEFIGNIVNGKSDFVSLELTEQTITIKKNVAVVRHVFTAATNDSGQPGMVKLKVLLIFVAEHGSWKLLARQAVKFT